MNFRIIPSLDRNPQILESCSNLWGRWTLLLVFLCLLPLLTSQWPWLAICLVSTNAFPLYRRGIVSLLGVLFAVARPVWLNLSSIQVISARGGLALPQWVVPLVVLSVFLLLGVLATLAFRFPAKSLTRRPVLTALLGLSVLVVTVSIAPLHGLRWLAAWVAILALAHMIWFFCYTLSDRNSRDRDGVSLQVGLWQPVWMLGQISGVPFAKGAAYLRRIEANSPLELAITQCKAMKLLLWALVLKAGLVFFVYVVYRRLGIPDFSDALEHSMAGDPLPWHRNWLSLIVAFLATLLNISVVGHQMIACVRMIGFRALRNTYRPLESRTVADFWNRYYFYFKELMVDMFFYPTYLRYFKRSPRLRMAAATIMAASVGNAIYHFFDSIGSVAELGWRRSIVGFQTYLFYCLLLGTGIVISQLRSRKKAEHPRSFFRARFLPILSVASFYCFLHIFDDLNRGHDLRQHLVFAGRLFGL